MFCPICRSKNITFFAYKNRYRFYRCKKCKVIFLNKFPSLKKLSMYYEKHFSYKDGLANEKVIRKRSATILHKIKTIVPTAKTICDVGSGYGFFLDEAKKKKYNAVGVEPSVQLANAASKNYNVVVYTKELQDYVKIKKAQFDVVTCIHVIEHVQNLKRFVTDLWKLVKPGGILYIETPNSDSHLLYVERECYTFLIPPEHLWIFSWMSIRTTLPQNAFIKYTHTYSYPEHFMGIIKRIVKRKNNIKKSADTTTKMTIEDYHPTFKKQFSYFFFDRLVAPLLTGVLNLYHKGSILELYIEKRRDKSGL